MGEYGYINKYRIMGLRLRFLLLCYCSLICSDLRGLEDDDLSTYQLCWKVSNLLSQDAETPAAYAHAIMPDRDDQA